MSKLFALLFLSFSLVAQVEDAPDEDNAVIENPSYEYVSLADNKVYDIEIIVFAYRNALPNAKTYKDEPIFDDSQAMSLDVKPEDYPEIDYAMFQQPEENMVDNNETAKTKNTDKEYTIPLDETKDNKKVLVWFEHVPEDFKLTPIWDRLVKKSNIIPLIHKAWRQPETPFDNPVYVKLNNIKPTEELIPSDSNLDSSNGFNQELEPEAVKIIENTAVFNNVTIDADGNFISDEFNENNDLHENRYADFTLTGMVALSQGRFMHFGHKLNLFRTYNSEDNIIKNRVFSLIERRQLKTDELNYFDSPWLGSIVKITEYTGEQEDENKN